MEFRYTRRTRLLINGMDRPAEELLCSLPAQSGHWLSSPPTCLSFNFHELFQLLSHLQYGKFNLCCQRYDQPCTEIHQYPTRADTCHDSEWHTKQELRWLGWGIRFCPLESARQCGQFREYFVLSAHDQDRTWNLTSCSLISWRRMPWSLRPLLRSWPLISSSSRNPASTSIKCTSLMESTAFTRAGTGART